jgi:hypothetical protein
MTTRISSAACAAIAFGLTVGLVAQDSATSQSSSAKTITVSGCVQRAQAAPTGTSGTAAASETKFILTNAAMSSTGATGTSGATAPAATAVASEYRLDADDAKLTSHVGHKVEITGTVEQPSRTTPQPPAASAANSPKLKVDAVKMVASTCP